MNKLKLFIENFLVYGLGGIINKIVPLIMIPIVTRIMPNSSYFGISDMSNNIISFASALAIMGMYDAMYRVFFDSEKKEHREKVCSTALVFTLITSLIIFILLLIFKEPISAFFFGDIVYANIMYITAMATLVSATNSIVSAPTRMQNKKKIFLLTNTISPILSYSIAIPLLLYGHYLIALPLATAISGITIEIIFMILNKSWFSTKKIDLKLLKQMLVIAIPLFPNFLIYWIFNSSDKVMITHILGMEQVGIYSVGSKLGQVSQLIYTAFAGGWQYFAFSTMKEKEQVKTNSHVFEYLGVISFVATMLMCVFSRVIFKLIFTEEYFSAYIVAPYLFMAPLLQMLFQVESNQFLVIKKTWPNLLLLLLGAVANVILNLFLIPIIGIEGASIATLAGYTITNVITTIVLLKMKLMVVSKRFIISTMLIISFFVIWRIVFVNYTLINLIMMIIITIIYILLYKNELINIKNLIKTKFRKAKKYE